MTPDDDPDELALRALFDSTSESPDGATLTRLGARALDVPARRQRRPNWLRWAPWIAPLAVAAGALGVWFSGVPRGALPSAAVPAEPPASVAALLPSASSQPEPEPEGTAPESDDPEAVAELGDDFDDGVTLPDGVLAPASDSDTDAWLAASDDVLGEGG